jgi:predicted metal-dependent HD superfamily phosphohydrolase
LDNKDITFLRTFWHIALFTDEASKFRRSDAMADFHANDTFNWLITQYQEAHRKYHNLNHLLFLFKLPPGTEHGYQFLVEKILFFFFHDCIYDIPASDNEARSSVEARKRMLDMGFSTKDFNNIPDFVCNAIELSTHATSNRIFLVSELLDADLSILGAEEEDYKQYIKNIREEYGVVSQDVWNEKRAEFLEHMLEKPRIFQSNEFYDKYEEKARINMKAELIILQNER